MASRTDFGGFVRRSRQQASGDAPAKTGTVGKSVDARPPAVAAAVMVAEAEAAPADLIEVGAIMQAYGVRGQVKVAPHAEHGGEALLHARRWWLSEKLEGKADSNAAESGGVPTEVRVLEARVHSGTISARLQGYDDRDAALALKGVRVHVRRRDFPVLADSDEFYWVDLIGLEVINTAGEPLGRVAGMVDNHAHSVLRVEFKPDGSGEDGGKMLERLIPFVAAYVQTVDLKGGRITVDWQSDY